MLLNYLQPSIHILGLRIDEPVTTGTDILLAAICFYAFFNIRKMESLSKIKWYFKYYFLTLGLGAMAGGVLGHALQYRLAPEWKFVSWFLTLGSVTLIAQALVEMSRPLFRPGISRLITTFTLIFLAISMYYTLWTSAFSPVKYYTIFGMLAVVGTLSYIIYHHTHNRSMIILMTAIGIGFLSAVIFSFGWGLGPWLNHNDISHLILTYSAYGLYKGAVLFMETSALV